MDSNYSSATSFSYKSKIQLEYAFEIGIPIYLQFGTFTIQIFSWYILSYISSPPYWSQRNLGGVEKFRILNCPREKEASWFVSDIISETSFPIILCITFSTFWISDRSSLFLIELMIKWAIMIGFIFSFLIMPCFCQKHYL